MEINQRVVYKGFEVTLSNGDANKLDKAFRDAGKHWTCVVKDKVNRKQMSFDVFGSSNVIMHPLRALYLFCNDADTYTYVNDVGELMETFGYTTYKEAKKIYNAIEKAYYKCRKFIGTIDDIHEIINELGEKWG